MSNDDESQGTRADKKLHFECNVMDKSMCQMHECKCTKAAVTKGYMGHLTIGD